MKKIITVAVFSLLVNMIFAQGGRIKVYFSGFECYRETWDDILHSDGKGDEVFFNFAFTLGDKNGNSKLSYEKRTGVYGDATGQFSNRISAGSFVDLFGNNKGGIKAGDNYRCNDLIGEYDMAEGDILTVIPSGWEHDPISDNSIAFTSTLRGFYQSINQKLAPLMIGFNVLTGNLGGVVYHAGTLGLSKIKAGGEQGELGRAGTRPLGMEKYGDFSPKLVVLNTPNLMTICNSDMGFGKGVIAVNYDEAAVGNLRDHGNYTLLLRIEYSPNQTSFAKNPIAPSTSNTGNNPPPPPPPSNTGSNKNITANYRKAERPDNVVSIAGNWTGTYGTGQNSTPSYYSFKLNADGTMQLTDARGNIIANGKYSFSNKLLKGSYTYNQGGTFSVEATLSANQLTGTWGNGSNASGGGKWVMVKNSVSPTGNIR